MSPKTLLKLIFNKRGLLSNLESIVGAAVAGAGLYAASRFGLEVTLDTATAVIGGGIVAGNQLLGGLNVFKRFDVQHKGTFDMLSGRGPGTSDSLDDASK